MAAFLLTLFLLAHAGEIESPCGIRELARCEFSESDAEGLIQNAKKQNQQILFIFGSERCGPCNAWKSYLKESKLDPSLRAVYLPLSFSSAMGKRPIEDKRVKKMCEEWSNRFAIGKKHLPENIARIKACLRKPTLYLVDPVTERGEEVNPVMALKNPASIPSHLHRIRREIGRSVESESAGSQPESRNAGSAH